MYRAREARQLHARVSPGGGPGLERDREGLGLTKRLGTGGDTGGAGKDTSRDLCSNGAKQVCFEAYATLYVLDQG